MSLSAAGDSSSTSAATATATTATAAATTATAAATTATAAATTATAAARDVAQVPIIDLHQPDDIVIPLIANACRTFGFFQIIHHDIEYLMLEFKSAMKDYFTTTTTTTSSSTASAPNKIRRTLTNARGYFDDELTKQKRDWKECLDIGIPGSRDWALDDTDPRNACLDGYNPPFSKEEFHIRTAIVKYFTACSILADRLARLMAKGLQHHHHHDSHDSHRNGEDHDDEEDQRFLQELKDYHSSYLRLNYYRPCPPEVLQEAQQQQQQQQHSVNVNDDNDPPILGISPHKDAGFLTILLQDESCHSLQVWLEDSKEWMTIHPPTTTTTTTVASDEEEVSSPVHALTINTGDMCMLWSNGIYRAPLHRVLTHDTKERYSAPFFYNPGYHQMIAPSNSSLRITTSDMTATTTMGPKYHPCLFGYFRAVRFAGDVTDLGVEIQLADYEIQHQNDIDDNDDGESDHDGKKTHESSSLSHHIPTQAKFAEKVDFHQPFSIEAYRPLLLGDENDV